MLTSNRINLVNFVIVCTCVFCGRRSSEKPHNSQDIVSVIEHGGAVKVCCIEDVARQLQSRLGISESDNYTSHRLVFMCDQEWADLYSCNFVFVSSINF